MEILGIPVIAALSLSVLSAVSHSRPSIVLINFDDPGYDGVKSSECGIGTMRRSEHLGVEVPPAEICW